MRGAAGGVQRQRELRLHSVLRIDLDLQCRRAGRHSRLHHGLYRLTRSQQGAPALRPKVCKDRCERGSARADPFHRRGAFPISCVGLTP
jgi:hypothetical protein